MLELSAFIGYQISSKFHKPEGFYLLGKALNKELEERNLGIRLNIEVGELPPGANLWEDITARIGESHITIFDISENNPNVLLETGISIEAKKHVILLKCEKSKTKPPSDLSSFIYQPYPTGQYLKTKPIVDRLIESIEYYLNKTHDTYFYHRMLWSLDPHSSTLIVPGELPNEYVGLNKFEDYIHLRTMSDLDAVFAVIETIHRLYPHMDISIKHVKAKKDLPAEPAQSNIILVGGPDFNPLAGDFDNYCPIEYCYDENDLVWLKHKKTKQEYHPRFDKKHNKKRATDYGFFLKTSVGRNKRTKLIFIGGARTWGVYGAAKLVSCNGIDKRSIGYENAKKLVQKFGNDPSLLIPFEVFGTEDGVDAPIWDENLVEKL